LIYSCIYIRYFTLCKPKITMEIRLLREKLLLFITMLFISVTYSQAQVSISGSVKTVEGESVIGASIALIDKGPVKGGITDFDGRFLLVDVKEGRYTLAVSFTGYTTVEQKINVRENNLNIDIILGSDALGLRQRVETGTFGGQTVLESSVAISVANQENLRKIGARNLADILETVPGYYVDGSAGAVFSRVYARGMSASASRTNGWYYNNLYEDGLPVSNVSWDLVNPDFFYRFDETVSRMEAIRGGSAITAPNSPGGIFNFISNRGSSETNVLISAGAGVHGNGQVMARFDYNINGAIDKENNWYYNIGGFFEADQGARVLNYNANESGQIKANVTKTNDLGFFKFYGKILNAKNVVHSELPFTNWENPTPIDGFNTETSSVLLPVVNERVTNGQRYLSDSESTRAYNNTDLVQPRDLALGFQFEQKLGSWKVQNNLKFSSKTLSWNTTVLSTNLPIGNGTEESFLPYYATGYGGNSPLGISAFDGGVVDWNELNGSNTLASVALQTNLDNPFNSQIIGTSVLPRDEVMIYHTKQIETSINEFMDEFRLSRKVKNHNILLGGYFSNSNVEFTQNADGIITTVEDDPKILSAVLNRADGSTVNLMTDNGLTNIGGFDYINAEASQRILSFFVADNWTVSDVLNIEAGIRVESVEINGEKDGYNSSYDIGGLDGDSETGYDGQVRAANGVTYLFDDVYNYVSASIGANIKLSDNVAFFARGTYGNKAPEMTYYFNNFINTQPTKAELQKIIQLETGIKYNSERFTIFLTGFYSDLENVNLATSVNSPVLGSYSPEPLFNSVQTLGIELEGNVNIANGFDIRFSTTLQDATATNWRVWDFNNLNVLADDEIVDFSNNKAANVPNIIARIAPTYTFLDDRMRLYIAYTYIGEQWANYSNGFQIPAFGRLDGGINFEATSKLSIGLTVMNALNNSNPMSFSYFSKTLTPNPENATAEYVAANPDEVFYARPTLPATALLRVIYSF
jgi:iron complex outermembrane receptor protein